MDGLNILIKLNIYFLDYYKKITDETNLSKTL